MKKNLSLIIILLSSLLVSCKDDPKEEALPDDVKQEEILESCSLIELSGPYEQIDFSYNGDELISSLKFDTYYFDCEYDESTEDFVCDSLLVKEEFMFTYTDDLITKVNLLVDGAPSQVDLEVTYNEEDQISILSFTYNSGGSATIDEYRLVYNGSGQVVKVENYDKFSSSESYSLYGYESFTYDGNNVVGADYFYAGGSLATNKAIRKLLPSKHINARSNKSRKQSSSLNKDELESTSIMTYDDKVNPLYGNIPFLLYSNGFTFFLSKNNLLTYNYSEIDGGAGGYSYSVNYSYEYNDSDLPILMRFTAEDEGEIITEKIAFNYSCK